jgi:sulfate transport system substrate-binding protein
VRRFALLAALLVVLAAAATAGAARQDTKLTLVAYSTPREAFAKLIPAFQQTAAGKDVSFDQSYGASGDQARAVVEGLHADVVELSLEPDMTTLVSKGIVARSWNKNQYEGMVTRSVVVFVVRDGNPKHLRTWQDLTKPGVQVVTPNPFTSGGAKWNVMAAYGAMLRAGKTPKQAVAYLKTLFQDHVASLDKSAREALTTFSSGRGDVLLTYENEALYAEKKGVHTEYHTPKATLLIETPAALTKSGLSKPAAKAFYRFLWSTTAQRAFAAQGYRPVVKSAARGYHFYKPPGLFTIASKKLGLNGWPRLNRRFFDPNNGIMAKIERSLGR